MEKTKSVAQSRDYWIWQETCSLFVEVYLDTQIIEPEFKSNLLSSAKLIMNNVSEGFESRNDNEFIDSLKAAMKFCIKLSHMYAAAKNHHYISSELALKRLKRVKIILNGIIGLKKRLQDEMTSIE